VTEQFQEIELKAVKAADLVESSPARQTNDPTPKRRRQIRSPKSKPRRKRSNHGQSHGRPKRSMRKKLEFFRGIDEIIKLGEEVKKRTGRHQKS
jgi:hypothetical protein